ncbi:hypothetical protein EJB05_09406, partial [Eragrostis curvula]
MRRRNRGAVASARPVFINLQDVLLATNLDVLFSIGIEEIGGKVDMAASSPATSTSPTTTGTSRTQPTTRYVSGPTYSRPSFMIHAQISIQDI